MPERAVRGIGEQRPCIIDDAPTPESLHVGSVVLGNARESAQRGLEGEQWAPATPPASQPYAMQERGETHRRQGAPGMALAILFTG